ncbi:hypothetical protein sos41_16860 [Alphaproteobacteria bacterium SO-S41]|nr:hypothetical protein sos41_16860 [Alphaproteobacteria bacterium SO-S41]
MVLEPLDFSAAQPPQLLRGLAALQADLAKGRKLPPVEKWNPPHCGPIPMRIARDGTWHYMGTPIGRAAMVRLFSTILRREPDGSHVLVTPVERVGIEVEDAPFIAVGVEAADGRLTFMTNVGDQVTADADHPIRVEENEATGEPSPYVRVRGGLEARLARPVFYELADLAEERDGVMGVTSAGTFFPLGRAA